MYWLYGMYGWNWMYWARASVPLDGTVGQWASVPLDGTVGQPGQPIRPMVGRQ